MSLNLIKVTDTAVNVLCQAKSHDQGLKDPTQALSEKVQC